MAIEKSIVFIHPLAMILFELKEKLEETGEYIIYEMDDLKEYTQTVGILDYSITFSTDLKKTSRYLQENKKFVKQPTSRNVIVSSKKVSPIAVNKLQKFGLDEFLAEDTNLRSLEYKIDMFFKPFERKLEKEQMDKQKTTTDFKVLSLNNEKEEINTNEKVRIEKMTIGETETDFTKTFSEKNENSNSINELKKEEEKQKQQRELEAWMKQTEEEEKRLKKKEELEKRLKEEERKKQEAQMQKWIEQEEKEEQKKEKERKAREQVQLEEFLKEEKKDRKKQRGILLPPKEIHAKFMSQEKKEEKKDPKIFRFEKVEKGKEFNFIDHKEKRSLEINGRFSENKINSKELEINLKQEKLKGKSFEISLDEQLKMSKEYEIELHDDKKESKELEIELDKKKQSKMLEATIERNKKIGRELEIKLDEVDYAEYELELDEDKVNAKEYELELDKEKESQTKDLKLKNEKINASEYELELDEQKNGPQIKFTDKKEEKNAFNKEIKVTPDNPKGEELEVQIKAKTSKMFDFSAKNRKKPKFIEAKISFDKKEGKINNKISKIEKSNSQFNIDLKQKNVEQIKKGFKLKEISASELKEKKNHKFVTVEMDKNERKEDSNLEISKDKGKYSIEEIAREKINKEKNDSTEVLEKLQKGEVTLDYSKFDKQKSKKRFRLRPRKKEPTYEEKIDQLLEEPEKKYYPPNTYGLEFLALLQDLYEHPLVTVDHIFKFLSFSLQKYFQASFSVFVFDEARVAHKVYDGHVNLDEIDLDKLFNEKNRSWVEVSIPNWEDETFQKSLNEFIYPLYEDNVHIGFVVSHFKDSIKNHSDATGAEMMIMSCRGCAFSLFPNGENK